MRLSIAVPAYNEEENIALLHRRLTAALESQGPDPGVSGPSSELSPSDAERLLARMEELSDAEIDRLLGVLESPPRA